jgi:hypothetical protein
MLTKLSSTESGFRGCGLWLDHVIDGGCGLSGVVFVLFVCFLQP